MWISLLIVGKHGGECSIEGDGLRAEGEFLVFIWLVSRTTGESRVETALVSTLVVSGSWISFLMGILAFKSEKVDVWFQLECTPEQLISMVTANRHFYVATFFLWYPNLIICY